MSISKWKKYSFVLWNLFSVAGVSLLMSCTPAQQPGELGNPADGPSDGSGKTPGYPTFRGVEARGEKNFATLINSYAKGKVEPTPWAAYFWPYTKNGIAAGGFMSNQSPAGKYDAARGNRTNAQAWEMKHHGAATPKVESWWGHCNGWVVVASLFPEPREAVRVNGIEFSVGDIKALLTEAGMMATADFFGERTDVDDPNSPKYHDTVPNQYFLVLTNYMGKLKGPVLIDRYTGSQVWNQPLAGYRFEYPKPSDYLGASPEAPHVYRILMTSTMWWAEDGVDPNILTHPFNFEEEDPEGHFSSRTLKMELWLDGPVVFDSTGKVTSSGNLIVTRQGEYLVGGDWRMGEGFYTDAWPDYMWVPYGILKPEDPDQDNVNPEVDIDWIKAHLLVPGGADDPSVTPGPVNPAPIPTPTGIPWPSPSSLPWPRTSSLPG